MHYKVGSPPVCTTTRLYLFIPFETVETVFAYIVYAIFFLPDYILTPCVTQNPCFRK
jgi:hypothetical protein